MGSSAKAGAEVWKSAPLVERFLTGGRASLPLGEVQIDVMARLVAATRRPIRRFLDLGCGDGILSQPLLIQHPDSSGVLLDFSEPMLAAARAKLSPHEGRFELLLRDYGTPDWVEAVSAWVPFDAVVSGFSIHHQPDARKRALYHEIHDLLSPGGIFVNVEHVSSETPWVESVAEEVFIDSAHAAECASGSRKTREQAAEAFRTRPDRESNRLAPVETQCEWLRGAGYTDVTCALKLFELAVFSGRRAV